MSEGIGPKYANHHRAEELYRPARCGEFMLHETLSTIRPGTLRPMLRQRRAYMKRRSAYMKSRNRRTRLQPSLRYAENIKALEHL